MGGNDADEVFDDVFLLRWDPDTASIQTEALPSLPQPSAHGQAALIGRIIYLAGGQGGLTLETATDQLWALDLSQEEKIPTSGDSPAHSGGARALAQQLGTTDIRTVSMFKVEGLKTRKGALSGRLLGIPADELPWRRAGSFVCHGGKRRALGQSHLLVLGADGQLFHQGDALKDDHLASQKSVGLPYHHGHVDLRRSPA